MLTFSRDVLSAEGQRRLQLLSDVQVGQTRKSEAELSQDDQAIFKSAITKAVESGLYSRMVWNHADMRHRMHSMGGQVGTQRFLAWHRDYLLKFEDALRPFEPAFLVPYWDWTSDRAFPAWMVD